MFKKLFSLTQTKQKHTSQPKEEIGVFGKESLEITRIIKKYNIKQGVIILLEFNNMMEASLLYPDHKIDSILSKVTKNVILKTQYKLYAFEVPCEQIVIVIPDIESKKLIHYINKLNKLIKEYLCSIHNELPMYLYHKIGSAIINQDNFQVDIIIKQASVALKHCIQSPNTPFVLYSDINYAQDTKIQFGMVHELNKALSQNKLRLAFQPIVNANDGSIAYYESLLRIIQDDGSIISAGSAIAAAEKIGLINTIDNCVLDLVAQELRDNKKISLSLNISGYAIDNQTWIRKFSKLMQNNPDMIDRLIIEITETAWQNNIAKVAMFVAHVQNIGCRVALDDFGAGYTSFRQLRILSVDILKIDGSFIRDIVDNASNRILVKAIADICISLGIEVVAEFVESGDIVRVLMDLNIDYMQGNYFSPALNYRKWVSDSQQNS